MFVDDGDDDDDDGDDGDSDGDDDDDDNDDDDDDDDDDNDDDDDDDACWAPLCSFTPLLPPMQTLLMGSLTSSTSTCTWSTLGGHVWQRTSCR